VAILEAPAKARGTRGGAASTRGVGAKRSRSVVSLPVFCCAKGGRGQVGPSLRFESVNSHAAHAAAWRTRSAPARIGVKV